MNVDSILLRLARNQSGVAAIEMALILPILMILFFGMIDLSGLLSDNRRVSYASNVVADMVTRLETPTTAARVDEAFDGVELIMAATQTGAARVEIHNFRLAEQNENAQDNVVVRWSRNNGTGATCGDPARAGLSNLMTAGNDIIVAIVCVVHTPIVTNIIGRNTLGAANFTLREQIIMRPRQSLTLHCSDC